MKTSSARAFMRRADYQPPAAPKDSPFRRFIVHCLHCGSFRLRVEGAHDEDSGELKVSLVCSSCRAREVLPLQ